MALSLDVIVSSAWGAVLYDENGVKIVNHDENGTQVVYDENGVPLVYYGTMKNIDIGLQRNPVTIANAAKEMYEYLQTKDVEARKNFLNNANWLVNNSIVKRIDYGRGVPFTYSILEYKFPFPPYNLLVLPWHSAMAQGLAIDVLVKAHELTGNKTYLDTAKQLLNAFFIAIDDGGVTYKNDTEGGWWYEEYAGKGGHNPRVLNGMQFALLGIHSFYNYTGDPDSRYLFQKGVDMLKKQVHIYDHNQTYSAYDRFGGYAPYAYHKLHVDLLWDLFKITKDDIFKKYHDGWSKILAAEG
jgi:heparosan-N-sulfate-glucuronate 5-epimerase